MCTLSYIFEYFSEEVARRHRTASRCGMPEIICLFRSDRSENQGGLLRLDGPDAAPTRYLLYSLHGQRGQMNTHNHINTKTNFLKTFANMVNRSSKDCRILQLRFTKKPKLQQEAKAELRDTVATKGSGSFYMWTCSISLFSWCLLEKCAHKSCSYTKRFPSYRN